MFPFSVGVGGFPYLWVGAAVALFAGVGALAWLWLRPAAAARDGRDTA